MCGLYTFEPYLIANKCSINDFYKLNLTMYGKITIREILLELYLQ